MVYYKSVNLMGYITVDYLLIVYGNIVARDPFSTFISTHGVPHLNLM